jgi:hypothetical protein
MSCFWYDCEEDMAERVAVERERGREGERERGERDRERGGHGDMVPRSDNVLVSKVYSK